MLKVFNLFNLAIDVEEKFITTGIATYDDEEKDVSTGLFVVEYDRGHIWVCIGFFANIFFNSNDGGNA